MTKNAFLGMVLSIVACGGGQETVTTPPQPSASATDTTPVPSASTTATPTPSASASASTGATPTFANMTHDQKVEHMKKVVLPKMSEIFQAYDAKKFANVTCMTCHGAAAKTGNFTMPNATLPKLTVADGFKKHDPKMVAFMGTKVKPEMATLLGEKPMDATNPKGFGCFDCHTEAK